MRKFLFFESPMTGLWLRNCLKYLLRLLIYGNIYIGLLAGGLTWVNSIIFGNLDFHLVLFIFFSAIFIYNLDRLFTYSSDYANAPERSEYIDQHINLIKSIILICLIGITLPLRYFSFEFIMILCGLLTLTLAYLAIFNKETENIRYFFRKQNITKHAPGDTFKDLSPLRNKLSLLKPLLLAGVWASTTVILPVLHSNHKVLPAVSCLFVIRFFEYGVNGVLFDYRDKLGDKTNKKSNLFLLGENTRLIFLFTLFFLITDMGIIIVAIYTKTLPLIIFADLAIVLIYALIILILMNEKKARVNAKKPFTSSWPFSLLLDGVLFLPVLFTLLLC